MPFESKTPITALLWTTLLLVPATVRGVDFGDTRLLEQPALSERHVAFAYDGDLWIAERTGGEARRLTSHERRESSPRFSPDGTLVAFSGRYDGNLDVFVVPVAGGPPRRLTWHPDPDVVQGFTPDGSAVLFFSPRSVHTRRFVQLFTVPVEGGGFPRRLAVPHGLRASYSEDGSKIAYIPVSEAHEQWKGYRGGRTSRIWLFDTEDYSVVEIPQPEGRANDTDPAWVGDRVYFRSDRNGELNLFVFDPETDAVRQLTRFGDFPILSMSAEHPREGASIVFEQGGWLHVFDTIEETSQRLRIGVPADLKETRPRFEKGRQFIRSASLSPSGARAAFGFRGEVLTLPAKKGDARNLTRTPEAHERFPVWSPDGTRIAWISDASGEYRLQVGAQDGRGEVESWDLEGAGFYEDLEWSPDGTKISYSDNSWSLYVLDLETGDIVKVGSEHHYGPTRIRNLYHSWSPDSKWLAYTLHTASHLQRVYLYSVAEGISRPITDGMSEVSEPVFDPEGRFLYFFSSTDAGPVKQWFAMSNADMETSRSLYLAVLAEGVESPLAPESDEETGPGTGEEDEQNAEPEIEDEAGEEAEDLEEPVEPVEVIVDFDGLDQRIVALPVEEAAYSNLAVGKGGKIYYLRSARPRGGPGSLRLFDLEEREEKTLLEGGVLGFSISADGAKLLYVTEKAWGIAPAGEPIDVGKTRIAVDKLEVKIDPRAEWRQIFDEAWRINRDYFYDPGMHGADWEAMRDKYAAFLPHVVTRSDLNRVIQWMSSELAVGHHRVGGGDSRLERQGVPGGLLGADYEIAQGRYRFAKVYGGLNWNPDLRSPLTQPGVDVVAGEYLLAVQGEELFAGENVYGRFEKTAGKNVEITVGPSPDGTGSRTVTVVPLESEAALRNRDWVESNLRRVHEATDGRVAYVYVPNTSTLGHTYFKRYFFPQVDKEAIIIDERYNGGGQVADYYIDHLRRPHIAWWATRYGNDIETPGAAIQGPKVMIIDESAGSGGDLLPWMFRKLGLGTLVGKRTWGGLVGILGFPVLMDGGVVTAPNLAIWTEEGGWVVENVGVPPDVEVEQWPAEVIAGQDPQLEKAIEIALEELERDPPRRPQRPPYPERADRESAARQR